MRTLEQKFDVLAARLEGLAPDQHLEAYKRVVHLMNHQIQLLRNAGAGGRQVCDARALLVDVLIRHLWNLAKGSMSAQAQKEFPPLALVALGGYGRAELNPRSDLDIMFLHRGQVVVGAKPLPSLAVLMDTMLKTLWDLGFRPGHSVRTVGECVEAANSKTDRKSMETKTSLIEARLVAGDEKIFAQLQTAVVNKCVKSHEDEYLAWRMADQSERHAKFGNSATMQEPNIKNGCGGLRDVQSLRWMAFFKYRTLSLAEMEAREFINPAERKQLESAYDLLLAVRNEMHNLSTSSKMTHEVLLKALQPAVALRLGYSDRSPSRRLEQFMRHLYKHMRNIYLITRTLEERLALAPRTQRLPGLRRLGRFIPQAFKKAPPQVIGGFKFIGDQIHPTSPRMFKELPRRLMRVFLHAQQRGLRLHPDVAQMIRRDLALVNRSFLNDEHVRETFLEILNARGSVAPILRGMHDVGLLGKYIPEFGKLTCLVQHEFYHVYAADEHTLMCLEQVDSLWESKEPRLAAYADLFRSIERPFILYLALLLHDSGKAVHSGNHSAVGGQNALRVARRLGLDGATTHSLRLLIEQHLTMAVISQRRDLDDPAVIRHFAGVVQTPENLRMLTLLTYADSQATSDKLWNGFKDTLLWALHHKAMQVLTGGTEFIRAEEKQRELLAAQVATLLPRTFHHDEMEGHFAALPPKYFANHQAEEIVSDLAMTHRFMHQQIAEDDKALEPVITWHNERDRGYTTAKVCTWDRAGLFSTLAGSFTAAGINILSAQIFSRADGIVIDTFCVTEARDGALVGREPREKLESILLKALAHDGVDLHALIGRQKLARPHYQPLPDQQIEARVYFDNDTSAECTVIDIETEDRLGLLYSISQVLTEVGLDISLAKISTEKGAAIDAFYVAERDGQKVVRPDRQRFIAERLLGALRSPD